MYAKIRALGTSISTINIWAVFVLRIVPWPDHLAAHLVPRIPALW